MIGERGRGGIFRGEDDELSRGSHLSAAHFRGRLCSVLLKAAIFCGGNVPLHNELSQILNNVLLYLKEQLISILI